MTPGGIMRIGVLLYIVAWASVVAQEPPKGIQRVRWLQGCWEAISEARTVEEHWMAPRGGSMVGSSRTVRGDQLAEYELVVIRERGEDLVYVAHPSGQPTAQFVASDVSKNRVVFDNPAHDFPQRVGYERKGTSLQAWIEGSRDGRTQRIEFPYRRAACASD
jgi:hypothetical protein